MKRPQIDEARVRSFTEEHKKNIARAKHGKALSPSHRSAISVANQGRSHRVNDGLEILRQARALRDSGRTITDIAMLLGVSRSTVHNMISGRHWAAKQ